MPNPVYYQAQRPELKEFIPQHYSKVLEIGCGEGYFRRNLIQKHEYWGVEAEPSIADKAKSMLDTVVVGRYETVSEEIPNHYFDLIICNDVIEHMVDHVWFLEHIKTKLTKNGLLVLSIPNARLLSNINHFLFGRDWEYRESGILDRTHLRFFTKKSLVNVLNDSNWKINKLKGINRYGARDGGPRLLLSYLAQLVYGPDSAYWQFAAQITVNQTLSADD